MPHPEALATDEAVARAARLAVDGAMEGAFSIDPIVGAELSRSFSFVASVIQRHGTLIQRTLADSLAASGRFEVMTETPIPITTTAADLLASRNADRDLARIRLESDTATTRMVNVDLVVVDAASGWAGAYDIKRGGGETAWKSRKPIEHDLRAIRLVLASHLKKFGHRVDDVTTGVVDYYGGSGFPRDIKIVRDQIDAHFGVPVVGRVDSMTAALKAAMHDRLREIIEPGIRSLSEARAPKRARQPAPVDLADVLRAPPAGPGRRPRPAAAAV
jgi:hypothetical protein